jgi:hypothetical protein
MPHQSISKRFKKIAPSLFRCLILPFVSGANLLPKNAETVMSILLAPSRRQKFRATIFSRFFHDL